MIDVEGIAFMYETFGSVSFALLLSALNVKNTVNATNMRPASGVLV